MDENVFNVGLEEIWKRIKTDTLSRDFVVFDNFEEQIEVFQLFETSRYPMKINLNMIIFCTEGFSRIKAGVKDYLLSENKFIIIVTDQIIQIMEISPNFKAGFILLKDEFLLEQDDIRSILFNIGKTLTWQSCFSLSKDIMEEEQFLFKSIRHTIRQKENRYRGLIVHHYFRIMLYHVCHIFVSEQEKIMKMSNRQDEIFYHFIKDVSTDFYQHRKILYYAGKASLTPKYFSKIIWTVSGKKAADWINEYVILEAKTLLKNTTMTIQQIGDKLNFSNQSYFSRYFTTHTGISPQEYRRK
ncbi:MAG: helix-turn-helix domain-containing protein [Massilibacteroides sp.]|nr:helix-turn-helix domain-containing protein [Massilibacteroides sp.]MDD3061621.1 helix-turn-helix domain-containing protein [Massilibacteroides sp.]MDD4115103.1 helix-turn-helix domain-containing protein [Massilibacteroides sp.]MDD4659995.1 helix-turn-helix domain-containing protein [Massilibacteroides sp.]